jgi:hypothetical protein
VPTRILYDEMSSKACFYDAARGQAFGPVFSSVVAGQSAGTQASAFLTYLTDDLGQQNPRDLHPATLHNTYIRWLAGELRREP